MRLTTRRQVESSGGAAGFTLLELLAVLLILSILTALLVTTLGSAQGAVQQELTKTRLAQLAAVLSEFELERGDYPPSRFADAEGQPPNPYNLGSESLVLALWGGGRDGMGLDEEWLGNVDRDYATKVLDGTFPDRGLRELVDDWDNPIAYFHHTDYGRADLYVTLDPATGEERESTVEARKSRVTGTWEQPRRYQLISAGEDGVFGTEDDLVF